MNIDPALRASSASQPAYNQQQQQHRQVHPYPDVSAQTPGYEPLQQASTNISTSHGTPQQHQYYGIPTPSSYANGSGQSRDSPFETSPAAGNPSDPNDLKRSRACEACRQLKVRCEPDETSPSGSCKRCAKANRQCVVTAPSRKRQKKTDSRVAELEKKIDALTASLMARAGQDGEGALDPAIAQAQMAELKQHRDQLYEDRQWPQNPRDSISAQGSPSASRELAGVKRKMSQDYDFSVRSLTRPRDQTMTSASASDSGPTASRGTLPQVPVFQAMWSDPNKGKDVGDGAWVDVIDRHIIDEKTAYRAFDRYHKDMCRYLPVVVFPPSTTAAEVRRTKPVLFLSIVAAAVGAFRPDVQPTLVSEVTRIVSDRIVYRGEKSLELVQAVQILTIYYQPPEKYEELNFNQMIHIAAVMALDIGMGKRSKSGAFAIWKEYMDKKAPLPDTNAAETRRAWLGCYYMCANAAMSLRRPLLLRWSAYNDECLELLATAPDALPSDKWLCHLVRIQHIAEDVGFQFSMDDPASVISLTDTKTQYHLKAFERQLEEWRQHATMDIPQRKTSFPDLIVSFSANAVTTALINHMESIINLYMHEIAMHNNHNIDDFKPPYNIAPSEAGPDEPDAITPAHIESLTICQESIHGAFNSFLTLDPKVIRCLPTIFFVRNSYAAVALIKMYTAVNAKGSKFGTIFKPQDLRVEYYLDALIGQFAKVAEGNQSRVAHKFGFIFNMLKSWHSKRTENLPGPAALHPRMKSAVDLYKTVAEQDPNSSSWNNAVMGANTKMSHSGLQMLSDAAMGKNTSSTSDPASAAAAALATDASHRFANADVGQMSSGTGLTPSTGGGQWMDYGFTDPSYMFTPEELNAMGNLMDDPGWMNFPMEQGSGWAF